MKNQLKIYFATLLFLIALMHCNTLVYAATKSETQISIQAATPESPTTTSDSTTAPREETIGAKVWYYAKGIIILGFFAFAIVYITITLIRKPRFTPLNVEEMRARRREKGKPESSATDDSESLILTDKAFLTWKLIEKVGEDERRRPVNMSQIKDSHKCLEGAIDLMPTSQEAIERINELGEVINNLERRRFTGSMKLIYCGLACCVLVYFTGDGFAAFFKHFWWLPATIVLYYFASLSPEFLNLKREQWFKGFNIHNVLIGTVLGLFSSTPVTETWKTTYTDGSSKKSEEFNPLFFIMLILTLFVVLVLGFFTFVFAGLNFVRNYIIYL